MGSILEQYGQCIVRYQAGILTILLILAALSAVVVYKSMRRLRDLRRLYEEALAHKELASLEDVLLQQAAAQETLDQRLTRVEKELVSMESKSRTYLQRWSLARYRAFKDVGGDQSFSWALLDANNDGVILTSIYGREESRIFAKRVTGGEAAHALSEEEKRVLREALREKSTSKKENLPTAENS